LFGFEWDNDNEVVFNLKRGDMSFEVYGIRVILPIEIISGKIYTKPMDEIMDGKSMDHPHNLTVGM
jgi:hypothetical protein